VALVAARAPGAERVAGHQREPGAILLGGDPHVAAGDDLRAGDPVPHANAVAPLEHDLVARLQIAEEREMRIAVPADQAVAGFAGEHGGGGVPRPEGERRAVGAGEDIALDAEARHAEARNRPGIRPRPGLRLLLS